MHKDKSCPAEDVALSLAIDELQPGLKASKARLSFGILGRWLDPQPADALLPADVPQIIRLRQRMLHYFRGEGCAVSPRCPGLSKLVLTLRSNMPAW